MLTFDRGVLQAALVASYAAVIDFLHVPSMPFLLPSLLCWLGSSTGKECPDNQWPSLLNFISDETQKQKCKTNLMKNRIFLILGKQNKNEVSCD